jgi:oligopeptide transport system substrate-binding protein
VTWIKRTLCLCMAAVLLLPLVSCSGKKSNQLVKYNLSSEPVNLDPPLADDPSSALVVTNLFEGLLRMAADGKLTEGVATDYEVSSDGLTYVFHLRTDAKWYAAADKREAPVTAHDFVFGFQRLFNPETGSVSAKKLYCIKNAETIHNGSLPVSELGVTAEDDYTLTIQLDYANSMFLTLLTTPAAMPCNEAFFLEAEGRYGLSMDTLMSNGAYYLKEWSKGEYLALRSNPAYQSATEVKNGGVSLYFQSDLEEVKKDFDDGNVHAFSITGDKAQMFTGKGNNIDQNTNSTWGLVFNCSRTAFANPNVVKALSMDLDRSCYEDYLPDYLSVADALVPPAVTMLDKSYRELANRVSAPAYQAGDAVQMMQGVYSALGTTSLSNVTVIMPKDSPHAALFSYISQIWQRDLQVYFKVEQLEEQEYQQRLTSGDFDCAVMQISGSYNSPEAYLASFADMPQYGILLEGYASLLNQASRSTLEQSTEYYKQAEQQLLNSGVFIPLYYQTDCFVSSGSVTGFIRDISGQIVDFKNCEFR